MHDEHPHPLLAQIPLTISPFLSLPTATPLPYTYKSLPSTLPPSILTPPPSSSTDPNAASSTTAETSQAVQEPSYIISHTGSRSTPTAILSSARALQSHLTSLSSSARQTLKAWEDRRRKDELAEKRRVAPGWLDDDVHLLVPENVMSKEEAEGGEVAHGAGAAGAVEGGRGVGKQGQSADAQNRPEPERRKSVGIKGLVEARDGAPDPRAGEELDRVFGGMNIR